MRKVTVDIETFSDVDIAKSGSYKYALSEAFDILLLSYAIDDGDVALVDLTAPHAADINAMLNVLYDEENALYAYNAAFEYWCINQWLKRRNMPEIPIHRWHCDMVQALYLGYPAGLAAVGEALGLAQDKRKMTVGNALIRKFCVPQTPTKTNHGRTRILPQDEPEKWELFKEYNKQDVVTEREIGNTLSMWPLPEREQHLWEHDVLMNARGVGVDAELIAGAKKIADEETEELTARAKELTGLQNPNSRDQLLKWMQAEMPDAEIGDVCKDTIADLLDNGVQSGAAEEMLQIRQKLGKTSMAKYDSMTNAMCADERIRGVSMFYGASRTGRYSGRLVQLQNCPQNHLEPLEYARELAKSGDRFGLQMCFGDVMDALSQLIRTCLIPAKGKHYVVADYSAIEARVVAWLAGEQWVLDAFNAGKDIYCATASQMFNVPVEKHGVNSHLRQRGKVATLALGYGGGESALIAMGALKMGIPEADLPEIKAKWREANPHIVGLWKEFDKAARAVMETGKPQHVTKQDIWLRHEFDNAHGLDYLTVQMPTGRKLFYAHPYFAPAKNFEGAQSLHYYNTQQGSKKWVSVDTWGGKMVENCTQAVARDCLCETLLAIEKSNLRDVFHVHDEVICEADDPKELQALLDIMKAPIPWAKGLPLNGAGFTAEFYQKD